MSKQLNKDKLNQVLKDFLSQNESPSKAFDAFDKDALEGFALLENEQEVFALKSQLDLRINEQFVPVAKKTSSNYWLAAAGFLLVIGLTVYFLVGSHFTQNTKLAVTRGEKSTEEKQAVFQNSDAAIANEIETFKSLNKNEADKSPVHHVQKTMPSQFSTAPLTLEIENNKNAEEKTDVEGMPQSNSAPPFAQNENVGTKDEATMSQSQSRNEDAEAEKKAFELKAKKSFETSSEQTKFNIAGKASASFSDAKDSADKATESQSVYYSAGEAALSKMLGSMLAKKDLVKSFDAVLFINKNGQVEKVKITDAFNLTDEQQNQIVALLIKLNGFTFRGRSKTKKLGEYKVSYR